MRVAARAEKKAGIVRNMPATLPPPQRILLIRLSAFGDVVIATGLLHGLRRAYPEAQIDWLVQPELAPLLRTQTVVTEVQVWDRKHWGKLWRGWRWLALWRAIRQFSALLRARDYDWVIDAQGLFKSRALARLAGGKLRIGYDSKEPGKLWMQRLVLRCPEAHVQRRFVGDEHAPMLQALTGSSEVIPSLDFGPAVSADTHLVVAPFTTRPQKHWPERHWVSLLRDLTANGWDIVLLGGPADIAAAKRLSDAVASPKIDNQVGQTSLPAAIACIAAARALIGVDTGLTHAGFALDVPTVALFGSTRPYQQARNSRGVVLYHELPCAPCARHPSCAGRWDCMVAITPAAVHQALQRVLPKPLR